MKESVDVSSGFIHTAAPGQFVGEVAAFEVEYSAGSQRERAPTLSEAISQTIWNGTDKALRVTFNKATTTEADNHLNPAATAAGGGVDLPTVDRFVIPPGETRTFAAHRDSAITMTDVKPVASCSGLVTLAAVLKDAG